MQGKVQVQVRDFSLWPLQATLLHRCYKALSHRRRLQQALAAVCHWKDTNLTPYPSSQIQLGFQVFGKDFIQEQQRMACLLDAYSEKLPTQCFFLRTETCLCEASRVKPTAHAKRHGTAKAQEAGTTSRHLQPVSAGWDLWKIDTSRAIRSCCRLCGVLFAFNSLQDSSNI